MSAIHLQCTGDQQLQVTCSQSIMVPIVHSHRACNFIRFLMVRRWCETAKFEVCLWFWEVLKFYFVCSNISYQADLSKKYQGPLSRILECSLYFTSWSLPNSVAAQNKLTSDQVTFCRKQEHSSGRNSTLFWQAPNTFGLVYCGLWKNIASFGLVVKRYCFFIVTVDEARFLSFLQGS